MNDIIKTAFDDIKADNQLKEKTKSAVLKAANKTANIKKFNFKRYVLVPACAVFVCLIGFCFISYNIEVDAISVDINPSVELSVNMYSRVISVKDYNADGEQLLEKINVNNMLYSEAVSAIIDCTDEYIDDGDCVVVTVESSTDNKADNILSNIKKCNSSGKKMYCYKNKLKSVDEAHSHGISFGKYNAYLELKKYCPDISIEKIKTMTMRDIKNEIDKYNNNNKKDDATDDKSNNTDGCNGQSNGYCKGKNKKSCSP